MVISGTDILPGPWKPYKFYKHTPPGDPKYFNNIEKRNYDGGVEGLTDADYPGGKVFKTGPTIQDEEDAWYRSQ